MESQSSYPWLKKILRLELSPCDNDEIKLYSFLVITWISGSASCCTNRGNKTKFLKKGVFSFFRSFVSVLTWPVTTKKIISTGLFLNNKRTFYRGKQLFRRQFILPTCRYCLFVFNNILIFSLRCLHCCNQRLSLKINNFTFLP